MNLNTKVIFTTEKNIKDTFLLRWDFKKENTLWFECYSWVKDVEEDTQNIVFIYSDFANLQNAINYAKENYILQKIILLWFSKIVRNQDIEAWDIIIPNTFLDENWDNPVFLDYAVWENYDLNTFWLILNWVLYDMWVEKTSCSANCNCSSSNDEVTDEEFKGDVKDMGSYKFLKLLSNDDYELTTIIRSCIKESEDRNNQFFVENLVNILDVVI